METKMLVEDNKGLEGFKKALISIAAIFFASISVITMGFYFFWEISTVGAIILLAIILWFQRDGIKSEIAARPTLVRSIKLFYIALILSAIAVIAPIIIFGPMEFYFFDANLTPVVSWLVNQRLPIIGLVIGILIYKWSVYSGNRQIKR